jgi:hypothetical protein
VPDDEPTLGFAEVLVVGQKVDPAAIMGFVMALGVQKVQAGDVRMGFVCWMVGLQKVPVSGFDLGCVSQLANGQKVGGHAVTTFDL